MASEIHAFDVTVPAGTAKASPQQTDMLMPTRVVQAVDVRIPPGARGTVGWALGSKGVAVLPREAGTYIVDDDTTISWPLEDQFTSGAWQLIAYNTGRYPHTLYVVFKTVLPPGWLAPVLTFAPLPAGDLSSN